MPRHLTKTSLRRRNDDLKRWPSGRFSEKYRQHLTYFAKFNRVLAHATDKPKDVTPNQVCFHPLAYRLKPESKAEIISLVSVSAIINTHAQPQRNQELNLIF
jgi:hypothetical protein